jgi:hypothetical protein
MAGSYSERHPLLTEEHRGDMTTRTGGGYTAADGPGMQFPDPDTIRGISLATMTTEQAEFINLRSLTGG